MKREAVKKFFEFKKDNTGTYVGIAVLCGLVGYFWNPALLGVALFGWLAYREKTNLNDPAQLAAVRFFKQKDVASLLNRAFQKANIDIDELVDFESSDMLDFEDLSGDTGDTDQKLRNKSVILLGTPQNFKLKVVKMNGRFDGIEINPWRVTILFLTQSQLIGYDAELDLIKGDLNTEEFHRMFLKDVVQIGTSTNASRIELLKSDKGEFAKEIREMLGQGVKEIVRRNYLVKISKTDGHALSFPIGVPEWRDGTVGALDMDASDEDARYMRIAQEMSQRIDEMKRGLPAS